jgi:ankyrin repeat protein
MNYIDEYTIQTIAKYCELDAKLILTRLNHHCRKYITSINIYDTSEWTVNIDTLDAIKMHNIGAHNGSLKLIEYAQKNMEDKNIQMKEYDFATSFMNACRAGHKDIIRILFKECDVIYHMNMHNVVNLGLVSACDGNHFDIAKQMIDNGADNWCEAYTFAKMNKNYKLMELLETCENTDVRPTCKFNTRKRISQL